MPQRRSQPSPGGEGSRGSGIGGSWRWVLAPAAEKQFARLREEVQQRICAELDLFAAGSQNVDIRKLAGTDGYRLRVGDFRVLYDVDRTEMAFVVFKIADRKDADR